MPSDARELRGRAAALVPVLRERATRAEQLRQIPPETVADLRASGLIRIGNPDRYGGQGVEVDLAYDVGWELARACGSTGWCYSLWTIHNWWVGHFSEQAQDELFADSWDTVYSSGLNPAGGKAETARGGLRLSGRWSFSSGCDAAMWAMVAIPGPGPDGRLWLLVPRADFRIVDTWYASGMRGSGSKDVVVEDVFVPSHRVLDPNRAGDLETTGWDLHHRLSYRVPLRCLIGWDLAAPLIGMAQGAVDEFTARLRERPGAVPLELRLAEASAEVDAARALHRGDVREMLDRAACGAAFTELDRLRYRRDKAFVAKLCVQAVNRLFEAAGARAIMESEPLQRFHRDVHAAAHHQALSWDLPAAQFGRHAAGLGPTP